ncbi:receptor-type protein kinase, putative [Bodo saltans]|uniref:Receptor-type protein kinase, putative n=1 Tax=Bodo saltans TaxID=75058 RepID=A0A0S4J4K6_BODSA|nr:receptor-type protein kinase, putative [Bodo saltans]|eukprot:CUG79862.1 receptor-type protein kinase, putative [Bodo saltans]
MPQGLRSPLSRRRRCCVALICKLIIRWSRITGRGLSWVASSMRQLTHLNLTGSRRIPDVDFVKFLELKKLVSLDLSSTFVASIGLRAISSLHTCCSVTHVTLTECVNLRDDDLLHLSELRKSLVSLNLAHCRFITGDGLARLAALEVLRSLDLSGCMVTDEGLGHVAQLHSLEQLGLSSCFGFTDDGAARLATLTKLTDLDLASCLPKNEVLFCAMRALPQLKRLDLSHCKTRSVGMSHIKLHSKQLIELKLNQCSGIDDRCLEHISSLVTLQHLTLADCVSITDVGLRHIASSLHSLRKLDISGCIMITDAGLAPLRSMKELSHVGIADIPGVTEDTAHQLLTGIVITVLTGIVPTSC